MKLLPEKLPLEAGVGMCEMSAPIVHAVEAQRSPRLTPVPTGAVLRLSRVAEEAAVTPPAPLLLTSVVEVGDPARSDGERAADDSEEGGWTGPALRRAREARGLTLSALADATKVTRHHLENIEEQRLDLLPSYVYLRGILLSLAKELRVDPQEVCKSYLENARRLAGDVH